MPAQQEGVGPPRSPLPRKKIPADLRSLARGHTALCIKVLAGMDVDYRAERLGLGCDRRMSRSCWWKV